MSDERGPWGFVVTDTLHMRDPRDFQRTACGDERVKATADGIRGRWKREGPDSHDATGPIYGPAEHRKVCKHCIAACARFAELLAIEVIEAEEWNDGDGAS